jgi:long-chain acyl-CoA synthetase
VEGYGLTEGGVANMNPIENPKSGSIGKALPGVEEKLAEDGELLIRSPTLFHGYFGDPETTAQVLEDGWLHTGDIAEIDADGYVYITGRKKELIVSSNGKKIYPARVEALFKMEPLINQVLLIGDRLPHLAALFTLNRPAAEALPGMESSPGLPLGELAAAQPVVEEVKRAVSRVNRKLASFEQIRKYRILDREFSIESGELTPTMKLRRAIVLRNLRPVVEEIYGNREDAAHSAIAAGISSPEA